MSESEWLKAAVTHFCHKRPLPAALVLTVTLNSKLETSSWPDPELISCGSGLPCRADFLYTT